jgi:chorismate dehydratase
MWDFEHGDSERGCAGNDFEISYTVPSRCAAQLNEGSADIGIIPVAAYATVPGLLVLPGVAIAARQAVRSILLVSKVPLEKIQTVALDTSSLTSTALIQVLFAKWWGGGRTFVAMEPDVEEMLRRADAALVIGDPALQIDRSRYFTHDLVTHDLAEEWLRFTGKPFVFAFWAVRQEAREEAVKEASPLLDLAAIFQRSRDHGLEPANLDSIAREWAARVGLSEADVKKYLTDNIHYFLDEQCLEGLQLFYRYAEECGARPRAPELRFLDPAHADTTLLIR